MRKAKVLQRLILAAFVLVVVSHLLSFASLYHLSPGRREILLTLLPPVYWIVKLLEFLSEVGYLAVYSRGNNGNFLALLSFSAFGFRLISLLVISGIEIKITYTYVLHLVIIYILGVSTAMALLGGESSDA